MRVTREFIPVLERNAPAAVVNVLTLIALAPVPPMAGVDADKAPPGVVAKRIVAALAAGESTVFPDDASAGAGSVYLTDPLKLEQMLAG